MATQQQFLVYFNDEQGKRVWFKEELGDKKEVNVWVIGTYTFEDVLHKLKKFIKDRNIDYAIGTILNIEEKDPIIRKFDRNGFTS